MTSCYNLQKRQFGFEWLILIGFMLSFCFVMSIFVSADWAGWILAGLIFLVPVMAKDFRNNKRLFLALFFIILAHNVASIINAYFFMFTGADDDAVRFSNAARHSDVYFALFSHFYVYILSLFYKICASRFFGQEISVLFFTMSCVVFIKFQKLIGIKKYRSISLLLFGLVPSYLIWGSVTLREPLELFFLMLAVYLGLHFKLVAKKRILYFCLFVFTSLVFGIFHWALAVYVPILIILFFFWPLAISIKNWFISLFCLFVLILIALYLLPIYANLLPGLLGKFSRNFLQGNLIYYGLDRIGHFQSFGGSSRTGYFIVVNFVTFLSTIKTIFTIVVNYLFGPFPWRVYGVVEFLFMLYGWLKIVLLLGVFISIKLARNEKRSALFLMLIVYFSLAILYALGTANYGTALRHQMLTDWILFVFGAPIIMSFVSKCYRIVQKNT
jgi:hypothetical protein